MTRSLTAALAFCAAATCATAAAALPPRALDEGPPISIHVTYTTAELRSEDGVKAVAFRIRRAADRACSDDNRLIRSGSNFLRCRRETTARAVRDLGAPQVAEALGLSMSLPAVASR